MSEEHSGLNIKSHLMDFHENAFKYSTHTPYGGLNLVGDGSVIKGTLFENQSTLLPINQKTVVDSFPSKCICGTQFGLCVRVLY
jgi:hypothetical protein